MADSIIEQAREFFDSLVKSRFNELIETVNVQYIKVRDLVNESRPITYGILKPGEDTPGGIPLIKGKDYTSGAINESNLFHVCDSIDRAYMRSKLQTGDIIFAIRGSVGHSAIVPSSLDGANITQDTARVSLKAEYDREYVCAAFDSNHVQKQVRAFTKGATIKGVNLGDFREFTVPIPSLEEQKKYASFIKQVDKSRIIFEQQVAQYDELIKSRFIEQIGDPIANPKGWPKKKMRDLLTIERGGSPRPIDAFITDEENGLNWIKIGDAVEGSYYINSVKEKIKPEGLKKTRQVYPGDLILSNSMSFGKPYILNISGCIHDGWLVLHDSKDIFNKVFLCITLGFPSITEAFKGMARGGVVNNLNKDLVGDLDMIVPPKEVQDEFVEFLEQVDKSRSLLLSHLKNLVIN